MLLSLCAILPCSRVLALPVSPAPCGRPSLISATDCRSGTSNLSELSDRTLSCSNPRLLCFPIRWAVALSASPQRPLEDGGLRSPFPRLLIGWEGSAILISWPLSCPQWLIGWSKSSILIGWPESNLAFVLPNSCPDLESRGAFAGNSGNWVLSFAVSGNCVLSSGPVRCSCVLSSGPVRCWVSDRSLLCPNNPSRISAQQTWMYCTLE